MCGDVLEPEAALVLAFQGYSQSGRRKNSLRRYQDPGACRIGKTVANIVDRRLRNGSSELLVQQLKKVAYSFKRHPIAIAVIDYAIAFALQRLRSRLAEPTREERRRNSVRSDVEPHDAAPLAIQPEPRRREKFARSRRQPAETARGFVLQILQIFRKREADTLASELE